MTEHRTPFTIDLVDDAWNDGAIAQLSEALTSLGLDFTAAEPDSDTGADAFLTIPDDNPIPVQVKRAALVSAKGLQHTLRQWDRPSPSESAIRVVVADRITADAREALSAAGWGWLDLRGHLHLRGKGLFVDTKVAPQVEPQRAPEPFAGKVGLAVAAAILLEPQWALGIRQLAGLLGRAPSSVSAAVAALRDAGLVTDEGKPRSPDLFLELVSVWKPRHVDVNAFPTNDAAILEALRVNIDDFAKAGWALSDTRAAAAYGAPVALRADHPPDFYVPDERVMRRAVQLLGSSAGRADRGATLRAAPINLVCAKREDPTKHDWNQTNEHWPLAQPLFVALDLAQDPGRGREVLDDWTPPKPWHRVW